jgi:hypothetical protein
MSASDFKNRGECHALNGEPRKIIAASKKSKKQDQVRGEGRPRRGIQSAGCKNPRGKNPKQTNPAKFAAPPPLADYVEVYSDPAEGVITAHMMRRHSEVAVRWWAMTGEGISVNCQCEKMWNCKERGLVYYPWDDLEAQMNDLLTRFREEYNLPDKKTRYFHIRVGKPFEEKKLKIPSSWRDEALLERARKGFDELSKRK